MLAAATSLPKFFPMLMTAAGTIAPARVLILGAGVAGLTAIGTARRLGAVVEAFDVRKVVKEQVESLGAKFVEVESSDDAQTAGGYAKETSDAYKQLQAEAIARHVAKSDVVLCTALIPGRRAPVLVTKEMVAQMKPGSVIVDLAAEQQGNCELTEPGKTVMKHGVTILGEVKSRAASRCTRARCTRATWRISGALDGSSGLLLSLLMSKAMNRSFANVLFGAFGTAMEPGAARATGGAAQPYNEATIEDAGEVLKSSQSVIFVPGYGMAVSQAQHAVRDLAASLERRGVDVKYAIHPVAGRMPGHMNVLLAEANVSYDCVDGDGDAQGREALLKYIPRPPIAQERVTHGPEGLVRITLKRPFADGRGRRRASRRGG